MTELDVSLAPGCFGMSMCFKEGSAECDTCPFAATCKPIAEEQLATLRAELGVVAKTRKPVAKVVPAGELMTYTNGLPKKVAEWMDRIEKAGIKVNEKLAQGLNPFAGQTKGANFLRITCHLLLKRPNGVARDLIHQACMTHMQLTEETTSSYVTQARQILIAVGAAEDVDGMLRLRTQ